MTSSYQIAPKHFKLVPAISVRNNLRCFCAALSMLIAITLLTLLIRGSNLGSHCRGNDALLREKYFAWMSPEVLLGVIRWQVVRLEDALRDGTLRTTSGASDSRMAAYVLAATSMYYQAYLAGPTGYDWRPLCDGVVSSRSKENGSWQGGLDRHLVLW